MTITIMELAEHRGLLHEDDGTVNGSAFYDVGLDFLGGCAVCGASIAAYNAYPSRSGSWKCAECIDGDGWNDVAEANADIFADR
jgi:hypothetical protein